MEIKRYYLQIDEASGKILNISNAENPFMSQEVGECDFDALTEFTQHELFLKDGKITRGFLLSPDGDIYLPYNKLRRMEKELRELSMAADPQNVLIEFLMNGMPIDGVKAEVDRRKAEIEQKIAELSEFKNQYVAECETAILDNLKKRDAEWDKGVKHNAAICIITKDENEYLDEFIRHHIELGFNHVFVYDNMSEIPCQKTVNAMPNKYREAVTVILQPKLDGFMQRTVYNSFIAEHGSKCRYVVFIDTDEFLDFKGKTVTKFLQEIDDGERFGCLHLNWTQYNANGKALKEPGLLADRFTQPVVYIEHLDYMTQEQVNTIGKCIVKMSRLKKADIHHCILRKGCVTLNTLGHVVHSRNFATFQTPDKAADENAVADCRHYFTKSLEEFIYKMIRGDVSGTGYVRIASAFIEHNAGMESISERVFARVFGAGWKEVKPQFQSALKIDKAQVRKIIEEELNHA